MPIYGLRTRSLGQTGYYSIEENCKKGDLAIIDAEPGVAIAEIVSGPLTRLPGTEEGDLPAIIRMADEEDLDIHEKNRLLSREAADFCKDCIRYRRLDMKLVDVEVFFDRSKFIFYFTAPNRIDFRDLVKDLVREYRARIELRQIGVRHETQMIGAIGNCGMVCCCRGHLRKFAPVTIKMAKEQNLFLNPSKISGICGRLLCCLFYEQENYENFSRISPRIGKRYQTGKGAMKILRTNMFRNSLVAVDENNAEVEMSMDEWLALNPRLPDNAGQSSADDGNEPGNYYDDGLEDDLRNISDE